MVQTTGSLSLHLSCSKNRGAALLTQHRSEKYCSLCPGKLREYMWENWQSWLQFAKKEGRPVQLQELILVRECTLTGDWANVTWDTKTKDAKVSFTAQVPGVISVGAGIWGTWEERISVPTHSGPYRKRRLHSGEEPVLDQCIFLKGIRLVEREWYKRILLKLKVRADDENIENEQGGSSATMRTYTQSLRFRLESLGDTESSLVSLASSSTVHSLTYNA